MTVSKFHQILFKTATTKAMTDRQTVITDAMLQQWDR